MPTFPVPRRHDVDWLRIGATYLLFLFHSAKVFDPAPFFHIRNDEVSFGVLVGAGFVSLWHMPLFFLLAGWSIVASLRQRGSGGFLRERAARLVVPLVAGCILFGPVIKYLELRSGLDLNYRGLWVSPTLQAGFMQVIPGGLPTLPPFNESFVAFLPTYFTHLGRFTWAHLWFVAYLLTFSLVYLPAFQRCVRSAHTPVQIARWWVYAPIAPLALIQLVLRPHWPGIQNLFDDWANVAYYSTYLWAGVLAARYPALEDAARAEWRRALVVGTGAALVLLVVLLTGSQQPALLLVGSGIAGWCFVVALFGAAGALLDWRPPALSYLSESAFPVYLLHQVVIVVVGYFLVLPLPLGIGGKFVLLVAGSLVATLGVYHGVVRRFAVTRFLFGMRPRSYALRPATIPRALRVAGLLGVLLAARGVAVAASPEGRWYAEGGAAQVEIVACGEALCGRVVSLRSPFDENGCVLRDRSNPDPRQRAREVIGLDILSGLRPAPDVPGSWVGGLVYDPASGKTYRCQLTMLGNDRLQLRGYVGIPLIGRTTTWLRVGAEPQLCAEAGQ